MCSAALALLGLLTQTLPARCLIYGSARTGGAAAPGLAAGTGALGQVHPDRCSVTLSLPARQGKAPGGEDKGAESGIHLGDNEFQFGGWVPCLPCQGAVISVELGAGSSFAVSLFINTLEIHVFVKE